jgi:RNA polymerase sigma factor (sigma-70 family)
MSEDRHQVERPAMRSDATHTVHSVADEPQPEQYMDLVRRLACSLRRRLPQELVDLEELQADGFEALVRASRDYDPSKGPFVPYALMRCRGAMIDGLRRRMLTSRTDRERGVEEPKLVSLEQPVGDDVCIEDQLADPDATTAEDVIERVNAEARSDLVRDLDRLPKRYQRILRARFVQRRSQREVAAAEGISPSRIDQIQRKSRRRLQRTAVRSEFRALTKKELKVLRLAAEGASIDETAKRLRKGRDTVKTQRHSVITKLNARNMTNAVAIAYARGLLKEDPLAKGLKPAA